MFRLSKGHLVLAIICKSNGQEGNCVDAYTFRSDATAKGTKGNNDGSKNIESHF